MTFVKGPLKNTSADTASNGGTGMKWEFAFTVTEKMRVAARLRNSRKLKLVRGFSKIGEEAFLSEISETTR